MSGIPARALRFFLLVTLLTSAPVFAVQHPVTLDPKTDSATCIGCHENKSKGKFVHSAIATGCTTCHEVRTNRDITHVKLTTATPYKLCLSCHGDKDASQIQGRVHPPAVRDCLKCHDPHTSDNKFQLLNASSGGEKENLCLSCHRTGLDVPPNGSRHAALDMGCETCHTVHKTGEHAKQEFDFHLTKAAPALCLDCHDPKDENLQKAHQNQPFATANCTTCHNPHQSASPKLMQAFQHNPFENKMCDTCHQPAADGKVVLTNKDSRALCLTCHDDKGKQIESAKVQHPGAMGECIDCHNPHASKYPGLPKTNPVSICLNCHSDQAEMAKKTTLHQPAFGQGCATCHEPHGGDRAKLLRADGNALCLECHGPQSKPQLVESEHVLTIFSGKVKLPEDYYKKNKVMLLPLRYGVGHPTVNHPIQDIVDPADASKVKTKLGCLSCHQPHASAQPDLLVKDQANNQAFCDNCHQNRLAIPSPGAQRRK